MKSFLRFILFCLWSFSFFIFVFVLFSTKTFLSQYYLKSKLLAVGFYDHAHQVIPEVVNMFASENESEGDLNNVTPTQLGKIIVGATDTAVLKSKSEALITETFVWMENGGQTPSIKIADLNSRLMQSQANTLQVPLELLNSGDFGIKFPEKIDFPVPKSFQNASFILKNKAKLIYGSLIVGLLSLALFSILRNGSFWMKLRSFGEAILWAGLTTGLFFGSFWGIFVASGTLIKRVTTSLKIPPTELNYIYGLISGIMTDFGKSVLILCGSLVATGLIIWIGSKFFIKKKVPEATVPKTEEAAA